MRAVVERGKKMDKNRKSMFAALALAGFAVAAGAAPGYYVPPPVARAKLCEKCLGSGECHKCEGTGLRSSWFSVKLCTRCEGTGWCAECGGYGRYYEVPPPRRHGYGPKVKHSHRKNHHDGGRHVAPAPSRPAPKPAAKPKPAPKPSPVVKPVSNPQPAAKHKPAQQPKKVVSPNWAPSAGVRQPVRKPASRPAHDKDKHKKKQ